MKLANTHKQKLWLAAFAKQGTILGACNITGMSRNTIRNWRLDPKFEERFQDVDLDVTETLEASALQRALAGDTALTIFLLKSRNPQKYRERGWLEVTGKEGEPITINLVKYAG